MIERGMKFLSGLSIRYKLLLTFLLLLLVIAVSVTFSINYYNQRFISGMIEESNEQVMREMNLELSGIYDRTNQLYLTFNNQDLYRIFLNEPGDTDFETIQRELQYENTMKSLVTANNLQSYITGILLYANEDVWTYAGAGAVKPDFPIEETDWYGEFMGNNTGRLVYGPLLEDFKSDNSTKNNVFYFIRSWHIPQASGILAGERPFILFSMDSGEFTNILKRFSGDTRAALVMDKTGALLVSVNAKEEEKEQLLSIIQEHQADFDERGAWFNKQWTVTRVANEKFGWVIYFAESTGDAFRDMNRLIRNIYLIILTAGSLAILLALYLTRKIVMPLTALHQMINKIEEKDVFLEVQTQDELGQIGERFNQMKHRLQDMSEKMYLSKVQEKEAQISALQAQINPHFLYNTLDNIYCIAQVEGSENITSLTENLSKMMRYSMSMKDHYVPLVRELEHVKSYVDILNVRFDNSITLKIHVAEEARDIVMPKLFLQPLAENAWNHGILPKAGHQGTIRFAVSLEGEMCRIEVTDDGIGIPLKRCREINRSLHKVNYDSPVSDTGSGIALHNVNNRIILEDGEGYGVRLFPRKEGGCRVIVRMKVKRQVGGLEEQTP